MSIKLKINKKPNLGKIQFGCDEPIHKKLEEFELTKNFLNESNTTAIIGRQKSGKTNLTINFVTKIYKKCFHKIYVFMPQSSRASLKKNIFDDNLDPDQLYEELNVSTIADVYAKVLLNSAKKLRSLIIFDDVQKSLKDHNVLLSLKNIIANQRHLRCVNLILLQNYFALDKSLREILNNVVLFKLNKTQTKKVFDECVESAKEKFDDIRKLVFHEKFKWLFINLSTQRIFDGFDEIIYDENDEE